MIYEYKCKACGAEHTIEHSITEQPKKQCPECGKMQLKRLISQNSFCLKGGGWAKDGY